MASGFGRDAGPANRGPGSAALAFGAGASPSASPSPAAPPVAASFPSSRPMLSPVAAPAPRFPSPRAQQQPAASYRPSVAAPVPVAAAPGAVRFPSSRPALDPGATAATTSRNLTWHLPRLAAPSISRPVNPVVSSSSIPRSPLSNQHAHSPADHTNGIGQRRLVDYADPLFGNGNIQPSEQTRTQSSEFGKRARSPPNTSNNIRSPSSLQNYPPVQIADPRDYVYKHSVTPSKSENRSQSPLHDTRTTASPLLNSDRLAPGSFRPRPALGSGAFPSMLGDAAHYGNSTQSVMAEQEMSEHIRPPQRLSAPFQSRPLDNTISKRSRSPTLSYQDVDGAKVRHDAGANARRLIDYTDTLINDGNVDTSKRMKPPSSEFTSMNKLPRAGFVSNNAAQIPQSNSEVQKSNNASLPKVGNQTKSLIGDGQSAPYEMFRRPDSHANEHNRPSTSPTSSVLSVTKRTGTPTLGVGHDDHVTPLTEIEREKQAKAKRLARFSVELSRPVEVTNDLAKLHKGSADKQKQVSSAGLIPIESNVDMDERTLADMGSPELAALIGLCPDMCPEPERAERERKGDLDKYERLGGDRNQTTELLAVKKYNRTAERDADLIRPMPVLQKTMEYLLSLLDHTYDNSFLGLYNFLWDRMRAIRMDLRMQHFFNQESISMLEQMIRLHIVAMHELCEYNKGEGFSEGFDAHLNIEQMNKTSVELFQMYDDHRRKGVFFSTEKEFRVYYALLKLDKHPGYKVEPAELSLDLAKMSHEIRGSPEILFAREVARACRMGNYIAFFRLARKATYLQACLMHAHFAKLRRQALASLHSGLQNSQGIPISHVVEWLAMEDEDIESLLDFHGFGLRQYEEMYLVKEGPFLNSGIDFPSGCSRLVHSKKSQRVVDDVSSGPICAPTSEKDNYTPASPASKREMFPPQPDLVIPANARREIGLQFPGPVSPQSGRHIITPYSGPASPKVGNKQFSSPYQSPISPTVGRKESVPVIPGTAPRAGEQDILSRMVGMFEWQVPSPKAESKTKVVDDFMPDDQVGGLSRFPQGKSDVLWSQGNTEHVDSSAETIISHPLADNISLSYSNKHREEDEFREHGSSIGLDMNVGSPPDYGVNVMQPGFPTGSLLPNNEEYDHNISNKMRDDWLPTVVSPKRKITNERLKIILRKWSQRAADKRFHREQKSALALAALNSLSLGPPVHQTAVVPKHAVQELDIGSAFKKRRARQQRSWSHLNVSELAGPILIERNPDARCICWKLLVFVPPGAMESQTNDFASKWLLKKLMGSGMEDTGMLISSADLSIWTKWICSSNTCCLSVVRASDQQAIGSVIANSTSCIIFVVSESVPWEIEKSRFSSLLTSIPAQSNLPLLILSGNTCHDEGYDYASQNVIDRLGLSGLTEGKISSTMVIFLAGNDTEDYANGFLDDEKLREGLKWLANNLPPQPDVTLVKTRELLLNYLNTSLERLNSSVAHEVGPEHCISVFNDAVSQTAEEILAAAFTKPNQWPAPEIDLLERSSSEGIFAAMFLPSIRWSTPSRIQPLLATIKGCKLPEFSYDLSWLSQGSYMGRQIQDQKLFLEECLMNYLTRSAQLLNETQAATEVKIMVQKGVGLELHDSYYRLVPRWVAIFRRIYNWRLAKLSTGEFSEAYVLSQDLHLASAAHSNGAAARQGLTSSINTTDGVPIPDGLSLDEMIEINCDLGAIKPPARSRPPSPPPPRLPATPREPQPSAVDINGEVNGVLHRVAADEMHIARRAETGALAPLESDDKLARLLAQCTKLQDGIDKRLYIYF